MFPLQISWFGAAFSLLLGMVLLTQEPGLMSVVVHLFFNIQHLTPSVVLKYYPPAGPNPPPDFLAAPHCPPPRPLILHPLAAPEGVCVSGSRLVDRMCPIFLVHWVFNLVFFFPISLSPSLMISAASPSFIF